MIDVIESRAVEKTTDKASDQTVDLMVATKLSVNNLHPYRDGKSSERLLAAVDSLISTDVENLGNKPMNLLRKWKIRKKLWLFQVLIMHF